MLFLCYHREFIMNFTAKMLFIHAKAAYYRCNIAARKLDMMFFSVKSLDSTEILYYNCTVKFFTLHTNRKNTELYHMEKNVEVSLLLDFYGELLKPAVRQMIDLYYNDDLSLAEAAEQTGITRQGVRDSIKRGEQQLFDFEKKLGLMQRFRELEHGLDEITEIARQIAAHATDNNITALAVRITQTAGKLKE